MWTAINQVFEMMPVAALIDDVVLAVHGGIGESLQSLDQLRELPRPVSVNLSQRNVLNEVRHRSPPDGPRMALGWPSDDPLMGRARALGRCTTCQQLSPSTGTDWSLSASFIRSPSTDWSLSASFIRSFGPIQQTQTALSAAIRTRGVPIRSSRTRSSPCACMQVLTTAPHHPLPTGPNTVAFAPDRVRAFCAANGLKLILRAHQCVQDGFEWCACD